jgi:histidine triad (HIT) family protein
MPSLFTRIVKGELPSYKVAEDERYLAFLDIFPVAKGHVIVIPKTEIDYIFDLEDSLLSGLVIFSKRVAVAIEKAVPCKRIGVAVIGLEVPHAHIHLIPLHGPHDIDFSRPKLTFTPEEFQKTAAEIRAYL